jgi:predicted transcriptional regulator
MMMSLRHNEFKQGELENLIINQLWHLEQTGAQKVYVSDIQERIATEQRTWAYTTVKTVMDRLADKKMVQRFKEGKKYYYSSLVSRETASRKAVEKLVAQYFKNDFDDLLACVASLKAEQVAKQPVTSAMTREQLERAYQQPSLVASLFEDTNTLIGG